MAGNTNDLGSMIISVGMDDNNFTSTLDGIKRSMKSAQSEMKAQVKSFEAVGDEAGALGAKLQGLNRQYELSQKEVQELTERHRRAVQQYGEHSEQAQNLGRRINNTVSRMADFQRAIQRTEQRLGDLNEELQQTESKMGKFTDSLDKFSGKASKFTKATAGIAVAIGAVGGALIKQASTLEDAGAKIEVALGGTQEEVARNKEAFKNVWGDGFGEDANEVAEQLIQVQQNIRNLDPSEIETVTKKIATLANASGADANEITRGVDNVMKAQKVSAEEALDLLTRAQQSGLNVSNELYDNMAEYMPLVARYGFSATEAFELMVSAQKEGVYNLDYINDAIKEFGIRAQDGSKATTEAMAQLSEKTQGVWNDFNNGKGTVRDVMNAVVGDLEGMDNQVVATQLGVSLFGTKFEDMGNEAVYAFNDVTGAMDGYEGSSKKILEAQEKLFSTQYKKTVRSYQDSLNDVGVELLELANVALPKVQKGAEVITESIEDAVEWWKSLDDSTQDNIVTFGKWSAIAVGIGAVLAPIVTVISSLVKGGGLLFGVIGKAIKVLSNSRSSIDSETDALNRNSRAQDRNRSARNRNQGAVGGNGRRSSRTNNGGAVGGSTGTRANGDVDGQNGSKKGVMGKLKGLSKGAKGIAGIGTLLTLGYGGYETYKAVKDDNKAGASKAVGGTAGTLVGAGIGGAVGSVIPVAGTAIGATLGGIAGGWLGKKGGGWFGDLITNKDKEKAISQLNDVKKELSKGTSMDFKIKGVSEETRKAMTSFQTLRTNATQDLNALIGSGKAVTEKNSQVIVNNQKQITKSVVDSLNKREKQEIEQTKKSTVLNKKQKADALALITDRYNKERAKTTEAENRINTILRKASKEKRTLTKSEVAEIRQLQEKLGNQKVKSTSKSEKESTSILKEQKRQRYTVKIAEYNDTIKIANKEHEATVKKARATAKDKISQIKYQRDTVKSITRDQADRMIKEAEREKVQTIAKSKDKRDKVVDYAKKQKSEAVSQAEAQKKGVVKEAEKTRDQTGSAWSNLGDKITSAWNSVRKFFGFDPIKTSSGGSGTPNKSKVVDNSGHSIAQHAKGTYYGSHKGGLSVVGEEGRELAHIPNQGFRMLGEGGQQVVDLPKGSAVLPHSKTERVLKGGKTNGMFNAYNFPHYAKGTGDDSFFTKALDFGSDVWGGLKAVGSKAVDLATKGVGSVWSLFKDKIELPNNLIFSNDDVFSRIKNLTSSALSSLVDNFLAHKEAEEGMDSEEFHWDGKFEKDPNKVGAGKAPNGLMQYVWDIYQSNLASKFNIKGIGGYSNRNMVGGSSKSMHAYGRAIDIFTASNSPDTEKKKIAEASRNLPLLQYVIYNKKWAKKGGGWQNYMTSAGRNPHTDHVHIDFKVPNKSDIGKVFGSGKSNVSGGAKAWTSEIKKAHKAIYGKEISSNGLAEVLEQIQTESGGNATVRQGITDVNSFNGSGGAKGLLQFIQSTFNNYKLRGYENIFNGYHQLLALFNVKDWYSAITRAGKGRGWSPRSGRVKPYANGGFINSPHMGLVGEDGPEVIIPYGLNKKARGLDLLKRTAPKLGATVIEHGNTTVTSASNNNSMIESLLKQNNELMNMLISTVQNKELNVAIGDDAIYNANQRASEKSNRVNNYVRGL